MNDKKVLTEWDKIRNDWAENKTTIDRELLEQIFQIEGGRILVDEKSGHAVGFLPFPGVVAVYFFLIVEKNNLKYVDERGINITEISKTVIEHAIRVSELKSKYADECRTDAMIQ